MKANPDPGLRGDLDERGEVVRLHGMDDFAAAVPHLLGFRPTESLVVVGLQGPRERMTFTLRLDLAEEKHDSLAADVVEERMARAEAEAVLVFVFTDEMPAGGALPRRRLVRAVTRGLSVPVNDAFLVSGGRVWSYLCSDRRCCPAEGLPLDPASPGAMTLAAAHAYQGRVVRPDRETVVASVMPIGGLAATSISQATERALDAVLERGPESFGAASRQLLLEVLDRFEQPRASVTDDEVGQLVVALHHKLLRDELIGWTLTRPEATRALLNVVVRRAQPPLDAPVCTAFGFAAYSSGDGVEATTAFERALGSDPDYSLAQMLLAMLYGQVPPSQIRALARDAGFVNAPPVGSRPGTRSTGPAPKARRRGRR